MIVTLTTGQKIEVDIKHQTMNRLNRKNPDLVEEHRYTQAQLFWFDDYTSRRMPGVIATGVAHLHPNDRFVKSHGVKVALQKALEQIDFSKEDRRRIWRKMWNGKYDKAN